MSKLLRRRIAEHPIRQDLTRSEQWDGSDKGLFWCWERGRQKRLERPDLAKRAESGELPSLSSWKRGSLQYLAEWQGLRGEDLEIRLDQIQKRVCAKTGKTITFKPGPVEEEKEDN
jgi:hypothetical protein